MRFVSAITFGLCLGVLDPRAALAGFPPDVSNWTAPPVVPVVAHDGAGVADPIGEVLIVARDLANQPMAGVHVRIDFSSCTELRLCADSHDPDAVVDCAGRAVTKITDANGEVRFRVVGYSAGAPGGPGYGPNCARIYGDGVLVALPSAPIYELTGGDGLLPSDLSAWLTDSFAGTNVSRADYDGGQIVDPADLSRWLDASFGSGSIANCSPGGGCP